jgi:hypothetical protein
MANAAISGLSAGAAVAATDLIPNVQTAGVGPVKTTAAQLKTFVSDSPTLVTPTLGVAAGTSLTLSGNLSSQLIRLTVGSVMQSGGSDGSFAFQTSSAVNGFKLTASATDGLIKLGATDAAAPVAQTLGVQNVVAGTSNTAGTDFSIYGSKSSGSGAGGSIKFYTSPAGASGTSQNAGVLAMTIDSTGLVTCSLGIVLGSTASITNVSGNLSIKTAGSNVLYLGGDTTFGGQLRLASGLAAMASNVSLQWSSDTTTYGTPDTILARDAANTLALRNGANTQTFNIYHSWTNASNYSGMSLFWSSTNFYIQPTRLGSGSFIASLNINTGASAPINLQIGNVTAWQISSSSHFLAGADNTYDIGASGANRPRNIYTSSGVVFANSLAVNSSTFNALLWNSGQFGWGSGASVTTSTNTDTGFKRSAAAIVGITNGSTGGGSLEMQEVTAPAAPAANGVRIYAEDNGGGKTRLMALFATGAAQQIAIEP